MGVQTLTYFSSDGLEVYNPRAWERYWGAVSHLNSLALEDFHGEVRFIIKAGRVVRIDEVRRTPASLAGIAVEEDA